MNFKQDVKLAFVFRGAIAVTLGLSTIALQPQSAFGAEKVKLIYGPFNAKISVESLEKYASTGEITGEFRLYSKFVDKKTLAQLRHWLSNRFECDLVEIYKFTHTSEGKKFLQELGTVIKTHHERNGFYAIRSSLIKTADKPGNSDGWTVIEAMQNFPTEDLQIDTKDLFKLQKFWAENPDKNQTALEIFSSRAEK
ncbi:MAG: alpha/beta hydrolase [Waterburya sp.]